MHVDHFAEAITRVSSEKCAELSAKNADLTNNKLFLVLSTKELNSAAYRALAPYMSLVKCTIKKINKKAFFRSQGVPDEAALVGYKGTKTTLEWTFEHQGTPYTAFITRDDLQKYYGIANTVYRYIAFRIPLMQWNNNTDLGSDIEREIDRPINNNEYIVCDDNMLDVLEEHGLTTDASMYDAIVFHSRLY